MVKISVMRRCISLDSNHRKIWSFWQCKNAPVQYSTAFQEQPNNEQRSRLAAVLLLDIASRTATTTCKVTFIIHNEMQPAAYIKACTRRRSLQQQSGVKENDSGIIPRQSH